MFPTIAGKPFYDTNPVQAGLTMRTNELSQESLVADPVLRDEVSAVQLELQRQILALHQEQHLQQQILLQHFHLRQKHLEQQHDQQLADRIRVCLSNSNDFYNSIYSSFFARQTNSVFLSFTWKTRNFVAKIRPAVIIHRPVMRTEILEMVAIKIREYMENVERKQSHLTQKITQQRTVAFKQ